MKQIREWEPILRGGGYLRRWRSYITYPISSDGLVADILVNLQLSTSTFHRISSPISEAMSPASIPTNGSMSPDRFVPPG